MSITRRSVLQGALVVAATLSARTSGALAPPPALLVYDSRLAQSRTFAESPRRARGRPGRRACQPVAESAQRATDGTVVGLTRWSDYVQARALLEEQRLRLRAEARWGSLFFWEMARVENAAAQALSRGV